MTMEPTTIVIAVIQLLLTLVGVLFGWLVKGLFDRIKAMETADKELIAQVSALRELLPLNYVRRDDFQKLGDSIFDALRRIEDKLDKKADKP